MYPGSPITIILLVALVLKVNRSGLTFKNKALYVACETGIKQGPGISISCLAHLRPPPAGEALHPSHHPRAHRSSKKLLRFVKV